MVYFVASWHDPTESFVRAPWEMQADGTWKQLKDPNDRGGDNNVWYEDKLAFIWPISNSIPDFDDTGLLHGLPRRRERRCQALRQQVYRRGRPDGRHLALEVGAQPEPGRRSVPGLDALFGGDRRSRPPRATRRSPAATWTTRPRTASCRPSCRPAPISPRTAAPATSWTARRCRLTPPMFKAGDRVARHRQERVRRRSR